ncbi:MAG: hypothetical protein UR87_C0015G0004 [candidate division CPR3 bacterium GW2011_GWE2_35_7]|nr:MAG: hypothetical protein UR87_C0015G0004 [candidate division CPR3 bacterium GW2011_GWE2_35_7]
MLQNLYHEMLVCRRQAFIKKEFMHNQKFNYILILVLVSLGILSRFLDHPANFTPIAAIALFVGVKLNSKIAPFVSLIMIVISDFFIGLHDVIFFTWGSFLIISLIGIYIRNRKGILPIIGGALVSSILFFIVTNFGVWMVGKWYELNLIGLIKCYTLAIPFFRNTLLGDLFYTGIFFGVYELALYLNKKFHFQKLDI